MAKTDLTAQRLRELFQYDQETGVFIRKTRPSNSTRIGDVAGCVRKDGYVLIVIKKRLYLAHRLAWLYVHGEWPGKSIDHIDGNPSNNRISNLRNATLEINAQNLRQAQKRNESGFLGVSAHKKKWSATIVVGGKRIRLGVYPSPQLAHDAYVKAKRIHHPGCTI